MNKQFQHKIHDFIERHQLLKHDGKYLVALSGGADSVALLRVLLELEYKVEAIHCNFHLRDEESNRDEMFCEMLCNRLNVPFHRVHFDTKAYAELHKVSIEMAARELRYRYFEQLRNDLDVQGICVAHHRDDQVETILINLIRGTGIHGLTGMSPRNDYILRPLLEVSREEIVEYLASIKQDYVTDSTNLVADVVRNKIRLNIIPLLHEINPSASENIAITAARLRSAEEVLNQSLADTVKTAMIEKADDVVVYDALKVLANEYTLYNILNPYGFSPAQVQNIFDNKGLESGREWLSEHHTLLMDRGRFIIYRTDSVPTKQMRLPIEGNYVYDDNIKFHVKIVERTTDFQIVKDRNYACLDADKVVFPLMVRPCVVGDRFVPFGMNGSKLISDFLTDAKKSLYEKRCQLVVTDANGDIVWVANERTDNRFRVTDATKRVLVIYC
ncbi:MAG: tRNA lysidine(34) synthetase TilS [Prevotella sp.]|nr:tRNA lysidine(34) synthetase TilS [Prevotella sp.]